MISYKQKLSDISILIADPDNRISMLIQRVLKSLGFRKVYAVRNGRDALAKLRSEKIDIAITDWEMDPMNGLEFINYIRTSEDSPNRVLPIIMLTGKAQRKHVQVARDAGMTEFVVKPFNVNTLCERLILVVEHPRNFIISDGFCGPDRRRREETIEGADRRADMEGAAIAKGDDSTVVRIDDQDVTIIDPDFSLQERIGSKGAIRDIFSPENVRTAQQIIHDSKDEFLDWIVEDMRSLENAYSLLVSSEDPTSETIRTLYYAALVIKSQAGTFGYDLASHVADSLVQITDECPDMDPTRLTVVRKHIDVLYVIFQRNMEGMGGQVGKDLLENLYLLSSKYHD